jgi:hypothetical protein
VLSVGQYGPEDNPRYISAVSGIVKDMQAHWAKLVSDPRPPQQQAAEKLGNEIERLKDDPTALQTEWDGGLENAMKEVQHLGDPGLADWVAKTMAGVDTWKGSDGSVRQARSMHVSKTATLSEYARRLQDPLRVDAGDAWGHYGWQTAAAQRWVNDVALAEGHNDVSKGPGLARARELSDEINRQGTDGKLHVMAEQVARASGIKPVSPPPEGKSMLIENQRAWAMHDTKMAGHATEHTPGLMTPNDWAELELTIRERWIPGNKEAVVGLTELGPFRAAGKVVARVAAERAAQA